MDMPFAVRDRIRRQRVFTGLNTFSGGGKMKRSGIYCYAATRKFAYKKTGKGDGNKEGKFCCCFFTLTL